AVPPCSGISSFPYSESFDGNTGLWTQETSDDLNWSFDTNSTPSSNTGPSAPTDGSSYMFTEASGSGNGFPNKVALLTSPCVDLSSLGNAELSFDYHMYGAAMGTLEMRASTDGGANWTTIWSQTGDQGNQWFSQSVSLAAYSGSVINLQISGTTGSDFTSDMAVDNLQIVSLIVDTDAPSVPTGLTASNTSDTGTTLSWTASTDNVGVTSYKVFQGGTSIGTSATTSFNVTGLTAETAYSFTVNASDAAGNTSANSAALSVTTTAVPPCSGISSFPYSESFDGNTGLWTQETSDDLNWSFDTNSTPSSNTGPSAPTDGSSYMFTEATGNGTGFPNKVALLTSPCVDLSSLGNAELNFDYHMYGAAMGTLEIRASTDGGTNWTTIWSQAGDQGNQWLSQSVSLSAYSGSVINLQISGTTGSNFTSDMAIDNLQIVSLIVDTQAPSVPTGLAASNTSDTGTTLSWTASTDNVGVTSYEVFQGGTSIGTSATPSFSVTGLTASTTYSFAVNASDAAGNASANSSSLNVTTNDPATTPVNFKVAFIGDAGTSANADAVLNLISAEGADAVVHAGDMTYSSNPGAFEANINAVLGANFPYFWSAGNHDDHVWRGAGNFQELGEARMNRLGIPWTGDLGVASTFTYQGIFFVAAAPQELGQTQTSAGNHIKNSLAANNAIWSIAYWHKNQTLMQLGGKGNEAGWPVYEESRKGGALIATGHEHSYARSHEMSDMQNQGVSTTSNTVTLKKDNPATTGVDEGRSFAFVSGLGGQGIRVATNNKQNNPWWASTYYDGNGGQFAALFGEFNYNGDATLAHFYYKDIDGVVVDDFFVRTEVESGSASLRGSNPENEQKIDVNDDNTVSVYPNPFNGAFTVNYEPDWVGGNLRVLSLNGAVIYQTELISENKLTVADSEFKRGFYLLVITKGNRTYRSKIIKQ
ncbi:fibronectin type III domain-containing protein, partial [Reichenbachiella sp.]|uniref:fibronectin type III domain-containing protein n=1 Tax=Reichenbachiella sp. TaxID=2184521 RepID=UPI0032988305